MSTLQKIGYRKIIYLLVLLSAVMPMLYTIGLPVIVSKQTQTSMTTSRSCHQEAT